MDIGIQAKILKAVEEKKIRRLGGTRDVLIDVRVICAMNEEPFEALKNGRLPEYFFMPGEKENNTPLDDIAGQKDFSLTKSVEEYEKRLIEQAHNLLTIPM